MDSQPFAPAEPALSVYLPFRSNSRDYAALTSEPPNTALLLPTSESLLVRDGLENISWQDDPTKILEELRAAHDSIRFSIAESFLAGVFGVTETSRRLSQLADESILASLKLALHALPSRKQRIELNEADLLVFSAGRLGASCMDFTSPLELTFLSPLAPGSRGSGRGGPQFDELERLVARAVEFLSAENGFDYALEIYHPEIGWDTFENSRTSSSSFGASSGSLTPPKRFGRLFSPRDWSREIESSRRADDRRRIISLRSIIGNSDAVDEILVSAATMSYKQYLSMADMEEFGALFRSFVHCTEQSILNAPSAEIVSSTCLKNARGELECALRMMQIRFGGQYKGLRTPDFQKVIATLRDRNVIAPSQFQSLQNAIEFLDEFGMRADAEAWAKQNCHVPSNRSPVRSTEGGSESQPTASPKEPANQYISQLATDWRQVVQVTCRVETVPATCQGEKFVADAILAPQLGANRISNYLQSIGFDKHVAIASQMKELEREEVTILSDARCRYYFSKIASSLLGRIADTPNPNQTLEQLIATTRSLGGKGILWQLFDANEACLELYVRLCGSSPYLTSILASNPGMIDELLDSLMLAKLPSATQMEAVWKELNRGALASGVQEIEPLLGSFKNAMHLNVGVREILGHSTIAETHLALSNISDLCVQQIVDTTYEDLVRKHGVPHVSSTSMCPFSLFTFGKYGGVEPNYHSDMTLLCLYQAEGKTRGPSEVTSKTNAHSAGQANGNALNSKLDVISNAEFYQLLAQRTGQRLNRLNRTGKLFDVKFWNLPNSPHAPLAWSVDLLRDYFLKNPMTSPQKLELSKARVVYGTPTFASYAYGVIQALLSQFRWTNNDLPFLDELRKQQGSVAPLNIKRGRGGTLEVEVLAQSLTLAYSLSVNAWEPSSTYNLLSRLSQNHILKSEHATALRSNYDFLRGVESGLRLMNTSARHDLPSSEFELDRLAYVLRIHSRDELLSRCTDARAENRELFDMYIRQVPASLP